MDYEKKYKEALERARNLHKDAIDMGENIRAKQCEIIFPELKEMKTEDEKIRKEIIYHIQNCDDTIDEQTEKQMIAWLEKQDSKNIHLMELKAKAYDDAKERMSYAYNQNRVPIGFISEIFPNLSLYENQGESKFEQYTQEGDKIVTNEDGTHFNVSQLERVVKKEPKKIEQKIVWNEKYVADVFERVGLAKIVREQSNDNLTNALQDAMIELSKFISQQKLTKNEEDERMLNACIAVLNMVGHKTLGNWLKSLEERIKPQWKPSDEQIQALEYQVHSTYAGSWQYKASKELLEQLKKL